MEYREKRFARDPRFRFFAMNTGMRWEALDIVSVFVQPNSAFRTATVAEMCAMLAQNSFVPRNYGLRQLFAENTKLSVQAMRRVHRHAQPARSPDLIHDPLSR